MIRKTVRYFKRLSPSWDGPTKSQTTDEHIERILRETWWLFGVLPIYSRDKIVADNM